MDKTVGINLELLEKATEVFEKDGYALNEALKEIFEYTIKVGKFPLDKTGKTIRKNTRINKQMCEEVWKTFVDCIVTDSFDFNYRAKILKRDCGISRGSAFIYLTVIKNMCSGTLNTRNMKIDDLKFFMNKIKEELDDRANENMMDSLNASIEYWKVKISGSYAEKVKDALKEFAGNSNGKLSASEILGNG